MLAELDAVSTSTTRPLVSLFHPHPCCHCSLVRIRELPWTGAAHPQPGTHEDPHPNFYGSWLHRCLSPSSSALQTPVTSVAPTLTGLSSAGCSCHAWALLSHSTAIGQSSESEPGDHRTRLLSFLCLGESQSGTAYRPEPENHYLIHLSSRLWWKN